MTSWQVSIYPLGANRPVTHNCRRRPVCLPGHVVVYLDDGSEEIHQTFQKITIHKVG